MKEIICPQCGTTIKVDDSLFAEILSQVKKSEIDDAVHTALDATQRRMAAEHQSQMTELRARAQQALATANADSQRTIADLQAQLRSFAQLRDEQQRNAILSEQQRLQQVLSDKDAEIQRLRNASLLAQSEAELKAKNMREDYERRIQFEKDELARYKEMKVRLSTKMVGESLEQHCANEFEQIRAYFPHAYFSKDNDVVEGTKGDFVFRDFSADGVEYISIMFEMKNESEESSNHHKNEDFLRKLDEDRRKKKCEFAVLVSMLEPDNELYNSGIVNKSHLYDKMYVIRPQFFIPLITLLSQTSRKSLEYKRELELAQRQNVDLTNFENKIEAFKLGFGKNVDMAKKKFDEAIKQIDESIKRLQQVRDALTSSESNLDRADKRLEEDLTIRKLTYGNPTVKAMIEESRTAASSVPSVPEA